MKKEYLDELEKRLKEEEIDDISLIMEKYERRYNFGLESGLSEEEIEKMLGSIDEIVNLHKKEVRYEYKESFGTLKLSVSTINDDLEFERSEDNEIHVYFEDIDESSYNINKTNTEISITYHDKKFFGLNRRKSGTITIAIPEGMSFSRVNLQTVSGDFDSDIAIDGEYINLEMVSGDASFERITSTELKGHVVTGDLKIKDLTTSRIELSSVSGDVKIDTLHADSLKASTVSGDIIIHNAYESMTVSTNSITGSIKINDNKYKNFTDKIGEW